MSNLLNVLYYIHDNCLKSDTPLNGPQKGSHKLLFVNIHFFKGAEHFQSDLWWFSYEESI